MERYNDFSAQAGSNDEPGQEDDVRQLPELQLQPEPPELHFAADGPWEKLYIFPTSEPQSWSNLGNKE